MRDGFRVYDTDTHIDPGADVLEKYVDPAFRARLDDLAPYKAKVKSRTSMAASAPPTASSSGCTSARSARPKQAPVRVMAASGAASAGRALASSTIAPTTASST